MEIVEIAKIEVAAGQRIGEKAGVESFLAAEADAEQFGVGEFQKQFGSEWSDDGIQPVEGSFRGSKRNLLFEDDVDERGEAGFADPQWRPAVFLHHFSQVRVTICQEAHTLSEDVFVQDGL